MGINKCFFGSVGLSVVTTKEEKNHNVQILRFVAAALVLVTHITFYIHERINPSVVVWHIGETGVPLFFVISGFVMYLSGMRLVGKPDGASVFLRRRVARIVPLYWLITTIKVIAALAIPVAVLHNKPNLLNVLASYFFVPMFNAAGEIRPIHGVAWTLLHEMMFYGLFSLALFLKRPPLAFCASIIVFMCLLGWGWAPNFALAKVYLNQINLLFVFGMLISCAHVRGFRIPAFIAVPVLVLGVSAIVFPELSPLRRPLHGDFDFAAVLIFWSFFYVRIPALLGVRRVLERLGDASYSLYLVHPFVAPAVCVLLSKLGLLSVPVIAVSAFISCLVVGYLLYVCIEDPLSSRVGKALERMALGGRSRDMEAKV